METTPHPTPDTLATETPHSPARRTRPRPKERGLRHRGTGTGLLWGRTGKANTGSDKMPEDILTVHLFSFPGLLGLSAALDSVLNNTATSDGRRRRGNPSPYPAIVLLGIVALARVAGSQPGALRLLYAPGRWQQIREDYYARTEEWLPLLPPNRDQVTHFRAKLFSNEVALKELYRTFTLNAIGQAQILGNLRPGVPYDGIRPTDANCIYGDGTRTKKFSEVSTTVHPGTGEKILSGSRAADHTTAKIQDFVSDGDFDGKDTSGLNHVAITTWTEMGRVVLAVGTALGAESWVALALIDRILATLQDMSPKNDDAIHGLLYDRAVTGWMVDYLASRGIQTYGKGVARNAAADPDDLRETADVQERVERLSAEYDVPMTTGIRAALRTDVIGDLMRHHDPLPLGLSIYPTSGRKFEVVHSTYRLLPPKTHTTPSGKCEHLLALDDGGLFEVAVDPDSETTAYLKVRFVPCLSSKRDGQPDGSSRFVNRYEIPCPHGNVEYERVWEPAGIRYTPESEEKGRAPADQVGWRLRPLSRCDDMQEWYNNQTSIREQTTSVFGEAFGRRNDSESFNNWFKRTLPTTGRATSQTQVGQEIDWLCGALVNNLITWITAQDAGLI